MYFIDGPVYVTLLPINKHPPSPISKFDDWVKVVTVRLLQSKDTFSLYLGEKFGIMRVFCFQQLFTQLFNNYC